MAVVPGIDVSRYQGVVNWQAVADAGYRFAVVRATLGNVKVDETFETNWDGAKSADLLVSAYHVVKPEIAAADQIAFLANELDGRKTDLPLVLDVELDGGQQPDQITACVRDCLRLSEQRFGRKPIIYTAQWFWNNWVQPSSDWAQVDLWVASYGTADAVLPNGWSSWKLWQYANNGQVPGIAADTDLNWFNGTYDDLLKYCRAGVPQPAGLLARTTVTLNVRNGPGVNYIDIGGLPSGTTVILDKIDGTDVWVQIDTSKWIAFVYKGTRYARSEAAPLGGLQARVLVPILNVRSGPGVGNAIVGQLQANNVAPIEAVAGRDAWGEFEPGQWIALAYRGNQYVVFI